jgi:serine/threonine protein kinase
MGVVYKARQVKLNRLTALKMVLAGSHAPQADLARFRKEAEAVARLLHPHIVQIYEVGEHDGLPFFSLEYCSGGNLEKKLNGTPQQPADAAALVETLARAIHAAHLKGVIHRDLKPANVLLTENGTLKVTDFGLAKRLGEMGQTATGAVLGTPSYMAPEQAGGRAGEIGPATDVYALGAILYECLTGRPPFKGATPLDTIMQVVANEPVPPSLLQPAVSRELERICLKCLQKKPAQRYGSAETLADDLRRFLTEGEEEVTTTTRQHSHQSVYYGAASLAITGFLLTMAVPALALVNSLQLNHFAGFGRTERVVATIGGYLGGFAAFFLNVAAFGVALVGVRVARRTGEPQVLCHAAAVLGLFGMFIWFVSLVAWFAATV